METLFLHLCVAGRDIQGHVTNENGTLCLSGGGDAIFAYVLHTIHWQYLQFAMLLCRNFRNIAYVLRKTVIETQLTVRQLVFGLGFHIASTLICVASRVGFDFL